jgi:hypothetical protein
MTENIIKFALDSTTKKPVFINDAANGLSCNCICAKCNDRMLAIQGKSANHREWHFRHDNDSDCKGGQETILHRRAKQIIVDNFQIKIPNQILTYSQARQEEKFHSIIPDVTVFANGHDIYFEVEVTNPVDSFKESFYQSGQYKSIKIDLTNIPYDMPVKELEELVLRQVDNKRIIFWEPEMVVETIKPIIIDKPVETYSIHNKDNSWLKDVLASIVGVFIISKLVKRANPLFILLLVLTAIIFRNEIFARKNRI